MRKTIIIMGVLVMSIFCTKDIQVSADTVINDYVEINESQFPSDYIRDIMSSRFDVNKDGVLNGSELETVKKTEQVNIIPYDDMQEYNLKNENGKYSYIDCTGLDIFENAKGFYFQIAADGKEYGLKNFDTISKVKTVESIKIDGDNSIINYNFSKFENLKKVELLNVKNVNTIDFGSDSKISDINIYGLDGNCKLDLSKLTDLKRLEVRNYYANNIKLGKNKKLTYIKFYTDKLLNKKITSVDISGVENLKTFIFRNAKNLKNVKIGKNIKLKTLDIDNCPKLQKIYLKKCSNLKNIYIQDTGLKKLNIGKNQKIQKISLINNKIKKLNLKNKKITYLHTFGIKEVNVSNMPKLNKVVVSKGTKVVKNNSKKVTMCVWTKNWKQISKKII